MIRTPSPALAASFSNIGHFLFHYFAAMYFTIVLAIERDWGDPYEVLMELWFPAALLIGLVALPAGRLADRWSSPGMLIIMFLGMGIATAACGLMDTHLGLMVFLAGLGFFAAIYHPVGIPWVIKTSPGKPGMRLAVNGLAGGLGAAAAAVLSGWLIELSGWRGAFLIPGVLCFAIGVAMLVAWCGGWIDEGAGSGKKAGGIGKDGNLKAVALMLVPMFVLGLIYNTTQNAMPKIFEERTIDLLSGDIGQIGTAVGIVYAIGAAMQLLGGYLADRFNLKYIYLGLWLLQAPLLLIFADQAGIPLVLAAVGLAMVGTAILPTENIMLSRFAPAEHQGMAFGVKFVVSFGAAPLGLFLLTTTREITGAFTPIFLAYAAAALVAITAISLLPRLLPDKPMKVEPTTLAAE